jgi:ribosomal protein L29
MKVNKVSSEEMQQMTVAQLQEKLDGLRRSLFSLRLSALTTHVKDNSQFGKLRSDIARVMTVINQKQKDIVA